MSERYRVLVRGKFAALTENSRSALLAAAGEHELLTAAFTEDGTLTYERELLGFSYRCEVLIDPDAHERVAVEQARQRATEAVAAFGCRCRDLTAQPTRVADIPIRRKSR